MILKFVLETKRTQENLYSTDLNKKLVHKNVGFTLFKGAKSPKSQSRLITPLPF